METVKLVLTDPKEAFSRIKIDGDYVSPFLFGLIVSWMMAIIGQLWSFAFSSVFSLGSLGSFGGLEGMGFAAGIGIGQVLMTAVIYPFVFVIVIFLGAGIYHLFLMILGALEHSEAGFEGTFKVACYSQVANLGNIVPLVGSLLSLVATIVLNTFGLERVHRTTTVKAALAVLIPFVLCCACAVGIGVTFGAAIMAMAAGAQ